MLASTTSLPLPTTGVWLRRARLAWIALALAALVPSVLSWPVYYGVLRTVCAFIPFLASMLVIPIYRYWRVFTPVERQQTKWAVLGFMAAFAGIAATQAVSVPYIDSAPQGETFLVAGDLIQDVGYTLAPLMIPLFIGVAILRSRLWDIDVIIRRTLIYSALTGLLAAAYFGSVLVSQSLLRAVTGQAQNALATVVSTLAIAVLIVPLRRRVQAFIDRRFYRQGYDAAKTVAAFAAAARDEVELDRLTAHMLAVVSNTLQPASVSLWLRPPVTHLNQRPWID
jgi:hypothetical protein